MPRQWYVSVALALWVLSLSSAGTFVVLLVALVRGLI